MGCGPSNEASTPTNAQISKYMNNSQKSDALIIKLLLLGPGSTGKSTLFKSLQILHSGSMSQSDKVFTRQIIRQNIVIGMWTLINQATFLYNKDPAKYSKCQLDDSLHTASIKIINTYHEICKTIFTNESTINFDELSKLANAIESMWQLESIKETYSNHGMNFAFSDNLEYFFENVKQIMAKDYVPSDQDCLKNRAKTTGAHKYMYDDTSQGNSYKYELVDVGGQRSERRKWLSQFDNVHGLLFVVSLIDYNKVLYEDSTTNGMKEAAILFSDTTKLDFFQECDIILILNKDDLLKKLLEKTPNNGLQACFNKENGKDWLNDDEYWDGKYEQEYLNNQITFAQFHKCVTDFISKLFIRRNNARKKNIYQHITVATENTIVKRVFNDIQSIVINDALAKSGLIV